MEHFVQVRFKNYKAFPEFTVNLREFNVLVGPNNAGKSTVLGAFRILSEAIRRARAKSPTLVEGPNGMTYGYPISLEGLPVSTENVFHNYNDGEPATVAFKISDDTQLKLFFRERGSCVLLPDCPRAIRSPADFRRNFRVSVSFVPVLGPVDHEEPLYQEEAARLALLSHSASRNFRNIWHHFPQNFPEFRRTVQQTWPGMDIETPEIDRSGKRPLLHMFCPESRLAREIFWAGFGFQVWCQMLTFILQAKTSSMLIIDEPDIYLHADLQRQLVGLLRALGPDIILATHSTEIISEVDPEMLLNINKSYRAARRLRNSQELQDVFQFLGSNLNPTLTQLAKTRRAVFVEGKDYRILSRFARKLGFDEVASRSDFAVIPAEGFNPRKVEDFSAGMEATLGAKFVRAAIFDRDYRSDGEVDETLTSLRRFCDFATVHGRKELENFLLHPPAILRAIESRQREREKRGESVQPFKGDITAMLRRITDGMKNRVAAQLVARRKGHDKKQHPNLDEATVTERAMNDFDAKWNDPEQRLALVPGKEVLAALNTELQRIAGMHLTNAQIIEGYVAGEIPAEMRQLIETLNDLRSKSLPGDDS
jgi:energy-coupling factor transporter ATP-binding protein EcfA2